MELQISTPYDRAYWTCSRLGEQHRLMGSPLWLEWLIRETGNDRLFAIRHLWADSTVLCAWVYNPLEATLPLFQELQAFKSDPRQMWPDGLTPPIDMLARLQPLPLDGTLPFRKSLEESKRAHRRLMEEASVEKGDMVQSLRRRGHTEVAGSIESGAVPWLPTTMQGKDVASAQTKNLIEASKGL